MNGPRSRRYTSGGNVVGARVTSASELLDELARVYARVAIEEFLTRAANGVIPNEATGDSIDEGTALAQSAASGTAEKTSKCSNPDY